MQAKLYNPKPEVMALLNMSEAAYGTNVLEWSYLFLQGKGYNQPIIEALHQTPAYWAWWRNQFGIGDLLFLNMYKVFGLSKYSTQRINEVYKNCHIETVAYPSRIIEKMNYHQLIKN